MALPKGSYTKIHNQDIKVSLKLRTDHSLDISINRTTCFITLLIVYETFALITHMIMLQFLFCQSFIVVIIKRKGSCFVPSHRFCMLFLSIISPSACPGSLVLSHTRYLSKPVLPRRYAPKLSIPLT